MGFREMDQGLSPGSATYLLGADTTNLSLSGPSCKVGMVIVHSSQDYLDYLISIIKENI